VLKKKCVGVCCSKSRVLVCVEKEVCWSVFECTAHCALQIPSNTFKKKKWSVLECICVGVCWSVFLFAGI